MARKAGLEINVEQEGDLSIVHLSGEVDMNSAETLKSVVRPLCNRPQAQVLLECRDLGYVNSACLGRFNDFNQLCEGNGGILVLCQIDPSVHHIMDLLGLTRLLTIVDSPEEALARFRSREPAPEPESDG